MIFSGGYLAHILVIPYVHVAGRGRRVGRGKERVSVENRKKNHRD